jgi:hypothetical protein
VRLATLYAVAALAIVLVLVLASLLREDCAAKPNDLDRALCAEK